MKLLMVMAALLVSANVFAGSDDRDKINKAKALFKSMTAAQALESNKLDKTIWNTQLPGTSSWSGPRNICIDGNMIRSKKPYKKCIEWQVRLDEPSFGKNYKTFTYLGQARRFAEDSSNAKGAPQCSASVMAEYAHPVSYTVDACVLWGVRQKDSNKIKTFKSRARASNYADDSSNARGNEFCMQRANVTKSFPSSYKVDFFAKNMDKENSAKVGSYNYAWDSCNGQDLPPIYAN